ncbi:hypothetical protein [Mesorhizobium sp.]|jgi:hypothetical protein|uniref:hypothetical protein n=1 Tax=Mesorhizobium sp. TaxID=1871066 RepID=UPI00356450AD
MSKRRTLGPSQYLKGKGTNGRDKASCHDGVEPDLEMKDMGFFGNILSRFTGGKKDAPKRTGDMRKATGAGPAVAAHSKDAKSSGATGQNPRAARKKSTK